MALLGSGFPCEEGEGREEWGIAKQNGQLRKQNFTVQELARGWKEDPQNLVRASERQLAIAAPP